MNKKYGTVYLVGAGPGDIALLTIKALKLLEKCDCLVYDRLIDENMLRLVPESCEKIYVGKAASNHALPQEKINELLCEKALTHKAVVRLKGGDPYVFGRGGEEGALLRERNIPFEVVPGISSAIGGLAYAGIPITHRDYSSSFHVLTGHFKDESSDHDWTVISKLKGTLVFLMSIASIPYITSQLLSNGMSDDTKLAVISNASLPNQTVYETTLSDADNYLKSKEIISPALLVVGNVINMRNKLNWYDLKPLRGIKIAVTRSLAQSTRFSEMLKSEGASVLELPMIQINPLSFGIEKDILNSITQIWFTSENAVSLFMNKLLSMDIDARSLANIKFLTIGPTTYNCLKQYGILADYMPSSYTQEGIIEKMEDILKDSDFILLPTAADTRPLLTDWLKTKCKFEELHVYETVPHQYSETSIDEIKASIDSLDYITFASASAVSSFNSFVVAHGLSINKRTKLAAIGPATAEMLTTLRYRADIVASVHTLDGLKDAIIGHKENFNE